jgi:glycosyltransferase involved in cell wall biosynthesis
MYNQEDVSLVMVNWNQPLLMELSLKSYVKAQYKGRPLKLILVDNGSDQSSIQWLWDNGVPFVRFSENKGHEQALNEIFEAIMTPVILIADTDTEFLEDFHALYLPHLDSKCKLVGEYITRDQLNAPVKPRCGAWLFLTDIAALKAKGLKAFRTKSDWSYDVLSEYTEAVLNNGFTIHHMPRLNDDIDRDIEGMRYQGAIHYGKLSWSIPDHMDREHEINTRMNYIINQRLPFYKDIDLRGKFTL